PFNGSVPPLPPQSNGTQTAASTLAPPWSDLPQAAARAPLAPKFSRLQAEVLRQEGAGQAPGVTFPEVLRVVRGDRWGRVPGSSRGPSGRRLGSGAAVNLVLVFDRGDVS
ncbi:hypothetical protein MC885_005955, partial [Smutsia gigantea]